MVYFTNNKFTTIKKKIKFVNIVMAGIMQKKLKSYISIAVPFEKRKRKTSLWQCCQKDEKAIERRLTN